MENFKENYSKIILKKKLHFIRLFKCGILKIGFQQILKTICGWKSKDWINNKKWFKKQKSPLANII